MIVSMFDRSSNPIDNMLKLLSEYTLHMEELVKQREVELHNEKMQVEDMLYTILPRFTTPHLLSIELDRKRKFHLAAETESRLKVTNTFS